MYNDKIVKLEDVRKILYDCRSSAIDNLWATNLQSEEDAIKLALLDEIIDKVESTKTVTVESILLAKIQG